MAKKAKAVNNITHWSAAAELSVVGLADPVNCWLEAELHYITAVRFTTSLPNQNHCFLCFFVPFKTTTSTLVSWLAALPPWRWKWYVIPKRRLTYRLYGTISQKMVTFTIPITNGHVLAKRNSLCHSCSYFDWTPQEAINIGLSLKTNVLRLT
jgi:hypothetical protein